jgi:hypothetical protein
MAFSQPYCSSEKTSYDYAVSAIQYDVNWKKALEANGNFSIKT